MLGTEIARAPFAGGTLVPGPDVVVGGLTTGADGGLTLSGTWPEDVPGVLELGWQVWFADPSGPQDLTATNGLLSVTS